ncbi:hypothetical protein AWENTII_010522 [Aspergillus wentii]
MHLVLPPAPIPSATPITSASPVTPTPTQDSTGTPTQRNPFLPSSRFPLPNVTPNDQGIRQRRPVAPSAPNEAQIEFELRRNIEAIRRQIDAQRRGASPLRTESQEAATTSSFNPLASHPSSSLFPQQGAWQPMSSNLSHPPLTSTTTTSHFTMSSDVAPSSSIGGINPEDRILYEVQPRLQLLRRDIELEEDLLRQGIAPPISQITRIRTQLFQILDDQYRNPGAPRDGTVESLLSRILNIYTRADQIRVSQSSPATLQNNNPERVTTTERERAPLYLLSSPDGYQALVTSPGGTESIQSSLAALRAAHTPDALPIHGPGHPPDMHRNPNAAVLENAVRQAVMNNNQRQERVGLARGVRRIWLFVRLYFFCYMFSEPGTWTRIFFVTLAVIISLLSETGVPQHLHRLFVAPVQQHLEGLVHFVPDQHLRPQNQTQAATGQAAVNPPNGPVDGRGRTFTSELRQNFRRVERSLALFIASLVPGVGERHIEMRNTAEAALNAERARGEEEERRRQEAGNEENAEQPPHQEGETARPEPAQHDDRE